MMNKTCRNHKQNQVLYLEGEKPQGVYCIHSGKVKICKFNREGREQIIRISKAGDTIGYHALISGNSHADSAIVIESAVICFIARNDFIELLNRSDEIRRQLLKRLSEDFTDAEKMIKDLSFKPVRHRMADALLLLKKIHNPGETAELPISISRADLANLIGTARETTTRLLTEFREENIIRIEGRNIFLVNYEKLLKISCQYD